MVSDISAPYRPLLIIEEVLFISLLNIAREFINLVGTKLFGDLLNPSSLKISEISRNGIPFETLQLFFYDHYRDSSIIGHAI